MLRKDATAALGEIGDTSARTFLELAPKDSDPDVRKLARWALQQVTSGPHT
jgi:HEAT repeat protein